MKKSIGNLYKTEVRALSRYLGISEEIISKAPSAGLWEGQTDEEELGLSYELIDQMLIVYENNENLIIIQKNLQKLLLSLCLQAKYLWLEHKLPDILHLHINNLGDKLMVDILNLRDPMVHKNIVPLLCEQAQEMIDNQLEACIPNVKAQTLENGVYLCN